MIHSRLRILAVLGLCILLALTAQFSPVNAQVAQRVRVLVTLNAPFTPEGYLNIAAKLTQRSMLAQAGSTLLNSLNSAGLSTNYQLIRSYSLFPILLLDAELPVLKYLSTSPDVKAVEEDIPNEPADASSNAHIQVAPVWAAGYEGTGQVIVILDTGVQTSHPFLSGKTVAEACFSTTDAFATTFCPNGQPSQTGTGSGVNCPQSVSFCQHGTHVAGIAAGRNYIGGPGYDGVARGANIISIQVFAQFTPTICGGTSNCALSYVSDQLSALQYVASTLASQYNIAAVNMSLGATLTTPPCDTDSRTAAINTLYSLNIPTVVASGNDSGWTQVYRPACITNAIAVGAVFDSSGLEDIVTYNRANIPNFLFAPGMQIDSSVLNNGFGNYSGTSEAAPHVAGAFALMRQKVPGISIAAMVTALKNTGIPVEGTHFDSGSNQFVPDGYTKPRIKLDDAVASIGNPTPTPTSTPQPSRPDTIGVYKSGTFYLRNSNTTGSADITVLYGGAASHYPVTGDWNGDGVDTIGIYDTDSGNFLLRDSNTGGNPDYAFTLGNPNDAPLSGRWDNSITHDGAGVYRNSNGILYLRNTLTTGFSDYFMVLGNPGDTGLAGDWNDDGIDTVGVWRPSVTRFYLSNVNGNGITFSDVDFMFTVNNARPFAGDWTATGQSRTGWLGSDGAVYYRYTLTTGGADAAFAFGPPDSYPLAGKWVSGTTPAYGFVINPSKGFTGDNRSGAD
jgi:subtilisin family serine protease